MDKTWLLGSGWNCPMLIATAAPPRRVDIFKGIGVPSDVWVWERYLSPEEAVFVPQVRRGTSRRVVLINPEYSEILVFICPKTDKGKWRMYRFATCEGRNIFELFVRLNGRKRNATRKRRRPLQSLG
jgi:hypothetical protein